MSVPNAFDCNEPSIVSFTGGLRVHKAGDHHCIIDKRKNIYKVNGDLTASPISEYVLGYTGNEIVKYDIYDSPMLIHSHESWML